MPMVDKPAYFCRSEMSILWDYLSEYVDFVELFGVSDPAECEEIPLPTNNEIEDAGMLVMCRVYTYSPIARCVIPLSPNSFVEVDCP